MKHQMDVFVEVEWEQQEGDNRAFSESVCGSDKLREMFDISIKE
jgi:hypothetical protein